MEEKNLDTLGIVIPKRTQEKIDIEYSSALVVEAYLSTEYEEILKQGEAFPQERLENFKRQLSYLNTIPLRDYWGDKDITGIVASLALFNQA